MKTIAFGATVTLLVAGALAVASGEPDAARGARLFYAQGCHGCHTVGAVGTPIGPDLSRVGRRHPAAWFTRWLADPSSERPGAHMPKLALEPADITALAAFLAEQRAE